MDDNDLPTSSRKKLKAHHIKDSTMDDEPASNMSSASHLQPAIIEKSDDKDRLDKEVQCGIIEFVSPHLPGFTGILKKRYTDFLVNEILPNGQVIHLNNLQKPSDHGQLSTTASKNPQEQDSRQANTVEENPRPQFVSTNLNKVEETSRKRETVYMRHGADSLSLVDRKENLHGEGQAGSEARKPLGPDSKHSETGVSHLDEEQDVASTKGSEIPPTRNAEPAEGPCAMQSGIAGTVGGWQAYAESNTNGEGSAKSSFQVNPYFPYNGYSSVLSI